MFFSDNLLHGINADSFSGKKKSQRTTVRTAPVFEEKNTGIRANFTQFSSGRFNFTVHLQLEGSTWTSRFNFNFKVQLQLQGSTSTRRFNLNFKVKLQLQRENKLPVLIHPCSSGGLPLPSPLYLPSHFPLVIVDGLAVDALLLLHGDRSHPQPRGTVG